MHWPLQAMVPVFPHGARVHVWPKFPGGAAALQLPSHWMVPLLHALLHVAPRFVGGAAALQVPSQRTVPVLHALLHAAPALGAPVPTEHVPSQRILPVLRQPHGASRLEGGVGAVQRPMQSNVPGPHALEQLAP